MTLEFQSADTEVTLYNIVMRPRIEEAAPRIPIPRLLGVVGGLLGVKQQAPSSPERDLGGGIKDPVIL